METPPRSPECFTLTAKDLWRYQLYALMHFSRLSPRLKIAQGMIFIWPAYMLAETIRTFVHLWIAGTFSPGDLIAAVIWLVAAVSFTIFNGAILLGAVVLVVWVRSRLIDFHDFDCKLETLTFYQNSKMLNIRRHEIYLLANAINDIYIIAKSRYIIIPKRAFLTDSKAQAYYQYLYDWWQKKSQTPDTTGVWPPAPQVKV